ncbi:hypothetical protein MTP99_006173 [Tenebrio molitor]|nr:hypothetical protein MTP99_006173 [Tenebrio molitor]
MSSCSQKRVNFTERDKQLLLAIVGKYAKIIEDKSTKNCVTSSKTATWTKLWENYTRNAQCETGPRLVWQLKVLYDNLKRSTRKTVAEKHECEYEAKLKAACNNAADDKKQLFKTGGGSAGGSKLTCTQEILLAELVHVEPLQNEFDSAASYFCIVFPFIIWVYGNTVKKLYLKQSQHFQRKLFLQQNQRPIPKLDVLPDLLIPNDSLNGRE